MQTNVPLHMTPARNERAGTACISVIIPAYNAGKFLGATLQSVFDQTSQPGEIIVVDDGSSDDTIEVARSFGVTVIALANGGPSAARNAGMAAATGTYLAFLDADDLWVPEKLAVQFAAVQSHAAPAFSFTDFRVFDESGFLPMLSTLRRHPAFRKTVGRASGNATIVIAADDRRPVLRDMYLLPSTTLVRREDALAIGGYDETLRTCEDYEFFLRLFKIVPAVAVMQPLMLYRRHQAQATASPIVMTQGLFEVEERVIAALDRYPTADARYIMTKGYLLHYRLGFWYARTGHFDEAVQSLQRSIACRATFRARILLVAALAARSAAGTFVFDVVRALWRSRPKRRIASKA